MHKPGGTLPEHYANVELPPRTWKGKAKAVLLSLWRWLGQIPVLADIVGVLIALGIGVTSVEEYAGSLALLTCAAIALVSNLWHRRDDPVPLKWFETVCVVILLLVVTLIIWDVKGGQRLVALASRLGTTNGEAKTSAKSPASGQGRAKSPS